MQGCVVLIGLPIRCVGLQSLFKLRVVLIELAGQAFVSTDKCFTKLGGGIPHGRSCSGSRRAAHIHFSALSQHENGWVAYHKSCKHINTITLSGICYSRLYHGMENQYGKSTAPYCNLYLKFDIRQSAFAPNVIHRLYAHH